jgi:hypothetical protein
MTVGRISFVCWTVFVVMCLAFLPLAAGIDAITAIPDGVRLPLAIAVVAVLWWGPFAYAMYLSLAVVYQGDRRLVRRGVRGTAVVLAARATNTTVKVGSGYGSGSRVYKYRLRVEVPGRAPYETTCSVCAGGYAPGQTVEVAVGRHNAKRVAIVPGPRAGAWPRTPGVTIFSSGFPSDTAGVVFDASARPAPPSRRERLIEELTRLGRLHADGVLTDAEFADQKARVLDELGDDPQRA